MKIALFQMEVSSNIKTNKLKIEKVAKEVSGRADILVLPETCLTFDSSFDQDSETPISFFETLSKKHNLDIICGFYERTGSKVSNTCYYFNKDGKTLSNYHKINLWKTESGVTKGNSISVFDTQYGKVGLSICWDLTDPILFRKIAQAGAKIIFCISFWHTGQGISSYDIESKNIDSLCHVRSFENNIALVYVNAAGTYETNGKKDMLIGHSQVTVPIKGAIKKLDHNKEELIIVDIDITTLKMSSNIYGLGKQNSAYF